MELIDNTNIEEMITEREKYQLYIGKLKTLSTECRQVLKYYMDGKAMKKIAELMRYKSVAYARKRKMICKQRLLDRIVQDPIYKELF
mgnify:FL=1